MTSAVDSFLALSAARLAPRTVDASYVGQDSPPARRPGVTGEATQAVLDAFAGSRVTSTRLRDDANRPTRGSAS